VSELTNSRREAAREWARHRRAAVAEERALARGETIYRVLVRPPETPGVVMTEFRTLCSLDAARRIEALYTTAGAEVSVKRSSDGQRWERVS
jgi:hypothetical protein